MHKFFLPTVLLTGLLAFFAARAQAQPTQAGQIVVQRVTGSVLLVNLADQSTVALQNGDALKQGFAVRTAKTASVVLIFSNGATINVGADSELSVDQFLQDPFSQPVKLSELKEEPTTSTTKLKLTHGEITGNVRHLHQDKGSSFEIDTPVGAAGIRGTTFQITYVPDGNGHAFFSIATAEGTVIFTSTGNQSIPVPGGVQITADVTVDSNGNVQLGNITQGSLSDADRNAIEQLIQQNEDVQINPGNQPGSPQTLGGLIRTTPGDGTN